MGTDTTDSFDGAAGAAHATPGSYGQAPRGCRLPDATRLGPVRLQIADLSRSLAFYEQVLGLRRIAGDSAHALLAAHGEDRVLVELVERAGARPSSPRGQLGLYHFAILFPNRPALGRLARHLAAMGVRAGAGDHLVSEALYLSDPDGLGIEVYADRPRSSWQRRGRELMIGTEALDMSGLMRVAGEEVWTGMPASTTIGHVHLQVGDLEAAATFYSEALGFDRMTWGYPGALFLGAGGYHHHVGTNTWAGRGARPPTEGDARLLEWTIEVPAMDDVAAVEQSLADAGFAAEREADGSVATRDPWGTTLRLRAASAARSTGR